VFRRDGQIGAINLKSVRGGTRVGNRVLDWFQRIKLVVEILGLATNGEHTRLGFWQARVGTSTRKKENDFNIHKDNNSLWDRLPLISTVHPFSYST
jgi:hypothetical protein